ncbi:MAG: bifunctional UDP-N-acetylglucosamine diphosphorylase/glucosamine-1-phosphate N-acetyltransferase GlmU [Gammaproteobacteria bacterium]|tara:strand:+ start:655 stop:2004 length:1350 start_codon:yes stop_codon:yes gene_type:complete
MNLDIVILAAGKGTRMGSPLPKVLANLAGRPMLDHVLESVSQLKKIKLHVVVGHEAQMVRKTFSDNKKINWIKQTKQLGTGHAVKQALRHIRSNSNVVILYGDVPLISENTISKLTKLATKGPALLTFNKDNPTGYGRIIRSSRNKIEAIIEEKDASPSEKQITEVNSGIMAFKAKELSRLIGKIKNNNRAKEFYLTDTVREAHLEKLNIQSLRLSDVNEVLGCNTPEELQLLEKAYHLSTAKKFLNKGVSFADIEKVKFRGSVSIEKGAFIDENVIFEGSVSIEANAKIGPGCIISNSTIGKNAELLPYTFVEESMLENNTKAGPFAHVGIQTILDTGAEIGNFVETKRSNIGAHSKAKHLAYIGDGRIGKGVNIGAGTIFCNYDGVKKHITKIEDDAFIGSNSALVAPLTIGTKSYVGSGSVVTKNVGKDQLAIGRGRQKNMPNRKK